MISLIEALQDYGSFPKLIVFWNKMIDEFIYEQNYDIKEYQDLCSELQNVWPINEEASRQRFLEDIAVKHVPFTKEDLWYAMCAMPNFRMISSNTPSIPLPKMDSVMFNKDRFCYEMSSVAFFNSMFEVKKYYRDTVSFGEIVLFVMACYFFLFDEISELNIRKFKKISQQNHTTPESPFSNSSNNLFYFNLTVLRINGVLFDKEDDKLPSADISRILLDCLKHFQRCKKFLKGCK